MVNDFKMEIKHFGGEMVTMVTEDPSHVALPIEAIHSRHLERRPSKLCLVLNHSLFRR